jgi:iron complex outermembrane receptor protein
MSEMYRKNKNSRIFIVSVKSFNKHPFSVAFTAVLVLLGGLQTQCSFAADLESPDDSANDSEMSMAIESNNDLGSVVISASKSEATLAQMPLHTTLITQKDIQNSPASSLDQLLRTIPGMNFTGVPAAYSDPTGTQTKLRGTGNDKVLVLVDGIPAHDPMYETTQWFRIPLSNIDRIEVMRGGTSSIWGSMAVGGVVNIITKRAQGDNGEVIASVGSNSSYDGYISKNVRMSDSLGVNFVIDQANQRGYQTTPSSYTYLYPGKVPSSDNITNAQISAYFNPSNDLSGIVKFGSNVQKENVNYDSSVGANNQTNYDFSTSMTYKVDEKSSLTGRFWDQQETFNKLNGSGCYIISATCTSASTSHPASYYAQDSFINYFTQQGNQNYEETGANLTYSKKFNRFGDGLQIGVDYKHLFAYDNEKFFSAPTGVNNTNTTLSGVGTNSGGQTFESVFAQGKYSPIDQLQITLGGRYDYWLNSDVSTDATNASTQAVTGGGQPTQNKSQFNPSVGVHFDLDDFTAFRFSAYSAFRTPGLNNELRSYGYGGSGAASVANPNLTPETMKGFELGTDYKDARLSYGVTYFFNNIENMIATYSVIDPTNPQALGFCGAYTATTSGIARFANCSGGANLYSNDQNGQANGLEMTARYIASSQVTLNAMYTRTNTFLTSEWNGVTTPLNQQLAGVPKDIALAGVNWNISGQLRAYAEAYYIGSMIYAQGTPTTPSYSQPANTILNMTMNYAYDKDTDLFAKLNNVLNRQYQDGTYTANTPSAQTLSMPFTFSFGIRSRF